MVTFIGRNHFLSNCSTALGVQNRWWFRVKFKVGAAQGHNNFDQGIRENGESWNQRIGELRRYGGKSG